MFGNYSQDPVDWLIADLVQTVGDFTAQETHIDIDSREGLQFSGELFENDEDREALKRRIVTELQAEQREVRLAFLQGIVPFIDHFEVRVCQMHQEYFALKDVARSVPSDLSREELSTQAARITTAFRQNVRLLVLKQLMPEIKDSL
tara:strand:- start:1237 stop:1677 length:441 start_codon:yes stop_codon:yes gene_type:complete